MSNEIKNQAQLEKLARMRSAGMQAVDIAVATSLTESRLSQIFATEDFMKVEELVANEQFEEQELMNAGWDGIEALGINKVVEHLNADPDPEFALKAAALANKASRRGTHRNNPIATAAGGLKAVVVLNNTFVAQLQGNAVLGNKSGEKSLVNQKKAVNFMAPKCVQDLLHIPHADEQVQQVSEELPEFIPLDASLT